MSRASRAINGFIAWAKEFVHQIIDVNGMVMSTEFDEQIAFLAEASSSDDIHVPDIDNDEMAVQVLDELMYRLKTRRRAPETPIADYMHDMLDDVIGKFALGTDQHSFATLPDDAKALRDNKEQIVKAMQPPTVQQMVAQAAEAEERIPYPELEAQIQYERKVPTVEGRCASCGNLVGDCPVCAPKFYGGELEAFFESVRDAFNLKGNDCAMVAQEILNRLERDCSRCGGYMVISPKNVTAWNAAPAATGGMRVDLKLVVNPVMWKFRLLPHLEDNREVTEQDYYEEELGVHFTPPHVYGGAALILDTPESPSDYVLVVRKYAPGKRPLPQK